MKKYLLVLILIIGICGYSQSVTTYTNGTPDDAIAIDNNGNIYSSNYTGDAVFKFSASGDVISFITGLQSPNGLAFNSAQELFICDGEASTIYKYDINGNRLASYSVTGHPSGIIKSRDSESMIFTIYDTNKLMSLSTDGTISELNSGTPLNGPVGLAFDDNDVLYVGNYNDRKIHKVENGSLVYIAQVPQGTRNFSPYLGFIAFGKGRLWGTILGSHKIYSIDQNATDSVTLFAGENQGSTDGEISEVSFSQPNGIAFDNSNGNMYITDFITKNLRVISGIGTLSVKDELISEEKMSIYPNPSLDILNIKMKKYSTSFNSITINNLLGEIVFSKRFSDVFEVKNININKLSTGIYVVKVISNNKVLDIQKFVKN